MWGFDANLSPSVLFYLKSIIFLLTSFMWSWRLCTLSCVVELLGSTKRLNINYQDPDGWVIVLLWVNLRRTCPGQNTGILKCRVSELFHSIFFNFISHSLTFPESVSVIMFMHVDFLWWCIVISFEIDRDKLLGSCWITSAHSCYRLKLKCCKCPLRTPLTSLFVLWQTTE